LNLQVQFRCRQIELEDITAKQKFNIQETKRPQISHDRDNPEQADDNLTTLASANYAKPEGIQHGEGGLSGIAFRVARFVGIAFRATPLSWNFLWCDGIRWDCVSCGIVELKSRLVWGS
jgi:hypothetical protein